MPCRSASLEAVMTTAINPSLCCAIVGGCSAVGQAAAGGDPHAGWSPAKLCQPTPAAEVRGPKHVVKDRQDAGARSRCLAQASRPSSGQLMSTWQWHEIAATSRLSLIGLSPE